MTENKNKNNQSKSKLRQDYDQARKKAQAALCLQNPMEVPDIKKVVLNIGLKDAVGNSKIITVAKNVFRAITGQEPITTYAKKSIAGFKIREGMPLGVCITLRGERMYAFLQKLIHLSLPRVRDFQGTPEKLDGKGNYNLGIKEWTIFPEAESAGAGDHPFYGMNITIAINAKNDIHGKALLEAMGMPFKKNKRGTVEK